MNLLQKLRLRIKGLTKWKILWIQTSLSQFYPFSLYFHMSSMMLEESLLCCNHRSSWRIGASIRVKILVLQPFKICGRIFFNRGWRVIWCEEVSISKSWNLKDKIHLKGKGTLCPKLRKAWVNMQITLNLNSYDVVWIWINVYQQSRLD